MGLGGFQAAAAILGSSSFPERRKRNLEFPREEEEEKGAPGSLPIADVRAQSPVREGAVNFEGTGVML